VAGYSHLAIAVDDLDAARAFYCGHFGFEELRRPDFGFPGMWLRVGDLQLHFVETDVLPTPGHGFPHFALHIPTEHYHDTVKALADAGVAVSEPQSRNDWGTTVWQAFLTDPAGNAIELTDMGPFR
jgi:catechol 2,3-dioxygenase-like lactoylglutathione lyase family enzyme